MENFTKAFILVFKDMSINNPQDAKFQSSSAFALHEKVKFFAPHEKVKCFAPHGKVKFLLLTEKLSFCSSRKS